MRKLLLILLLALIPGCGPSPTPLPIYLGHVATTSGPTRALGEQEVLGIRLAIEELTREGQDRLGERPIVVKHADAHGQLDAIEGEAVRLVTISRVVALYGGNSIEEVNRLDRSLVPLLTPLGTRPRGLSQLTFGIGIAPAAQAHALARFAALDQGVRSMAIVMDDRREESRALAEAFEIEFHKALEEKHAGEKSAKPERVVFGKDANFSALAQRMDAAKVQGVLFAGSAQDFEQWCSALSSAEFLIFFGGEDGTVREPRLQSAFLTSAFAVDKELPKTGAFVQRFREAFKEEPDVHAALAYDGIRILVDALRRAQNPGGERFLEELRQTKDFPGLTGPLNFGADQHLRRPVFVGRMSGTRFEAVKRYDPPNP
ncbi:MAG TPA: ABC transporter substrate-binding protein [Gemmataceae bacterium]|jgi:branched-chain amino acid transport system substrate-binding protein|nr:ABC transporter substrate-binding protein [Gemmataceae bacterium]